MVQGMGKLNREKTAKKKHKKPKKTHKTKPGYLAIRVSNWSLILVGKA